MDDDRLLGWPGNLASKIPRPMVFRFLPYSICTRDYVLYGLEHDERSGNGYCEQSSLKLTAVLGDSSCPGASRFVDSTVMATLEWTKALQVDNQVDNLIEAADNQNQDKGTRNHK